MRFRSIVVAALLACAGAAGAEERKLPPADDAAKDPSWVAFKHRLLNALQKRDPKFLLAVTDPHVRNTASGERGLAEFRKQWNLDSDGSPIWSELSSALFLGAAYIERETEKGRKVQELCAPYVLAKWPQDVDPFGHGAIVVAETRVKKEASSGSTTEQMLSYDIVPVLDWDVADQDASTPQRWVKVRTPGGEGYVAEEHVRSPVELAACFQKGPNGWRMTAFAPAGGG